MRPSNVLFSMYVHYYEECVCLFVHGASPATVLYSPPSAQTSLLLLLIFDTLTNTQEASQPAYAIDQSEHYYNVLSRLLELKREMLATGKHKASKEER